MRISRIQRFEGLGLDVELNNNCSYADLGQVQSIQEIQSDDGTIIESSFEGNGRCFRAELEGGGKFAFVICKKDLSPSMYILVRGHEETHAIIHFLGEGAISYLERILEKSGMPIKLGKEDEEIQASVMGIYALIKRGVNTNFAFSTEDSERQEYLERAIELVRNYRPDLGLQSLMESERKYYYNKQHPLDLELVKNFWYSLNEFRDASP
tara:strand:- start:930 stop:1559 length:630 start_codon:yes stop_codon:yes gene_type:complete